jgi:hypothetical protein
MMLLDEPHPSVKDGCIATVAPIPPNVVPEFTITRETGF